MNGAKDIQIAGDWSSAAELAKSLSATPMVIDAALTDRLFKLSRGHYLRRGLNEAAEPKVQAFFDDGDHHHLIEIEMPSDQDAFDELVTLVSPAPMTNGAAFAKSEPDAPAEPAKPNGRATPSLAEKSMSVRRPAARPKPPPKPARPKGQTKSVRPTPTARPIGLSAQIRRRVRAILPGIVRAEVDAYLRRALG